MPDRIERFTNESRHVLNLSQREAEQRHHSYIGTEHLLLALAHEESKDTSLRLREGGILYDQVAGLVQDSNNPSLDNQLDLTPEIKRVLVIAVDEARRMGHQFIGPEHLLLGLTRHSKGKGYAILRQLKVNPEALYSLTRDGLKSAPHEYFAEALNLIVAAAQREAEQLKNRTIEPEHLLLGLMEMKGSAAALVMEKLDLDQERVRYLTQKIRPKPFQDSMGKPELSHEANIVLRKAAPRMLDENFADRLFIALVSEAWILSDLWTLAGIPQEKVQDALDMIEFKVAGVKVRIWDNKRDTRREAQQVFDAYFPPKLRASIRQVFRKILRENP